MKNGPGAVALEPSNRDRFVTPFESSKETLTERHYARGGFFSSLPVRSLQRIEHARADFIHRAEPGNAPVLRRLQAVPIAAFCPLVVVLDKGLRLRDIHVETLPDRFFPVVVA